MMRHQTAAPTRDDNGTWSFVVDLGPGLDSKNIWRERRQARRPGFPTKKAAQEAMDELRHSVRSATYIAPTNQTLAQYLEEWLTTIEPTVRPSTHHSYGRNIRLHVLPRLGGVPLRSIDGGVLNALYADLLARGNKGHAVGTGLAPRTVHYIAAILHRGFRDAVRWGRLVRNPADAADPPKASAATAPHMATWSAAQVGRYLDHSRTEKDRYHGLWVLLATTGLRRGEALGLTWTDLDP